MAFCAVFVVGRSLWPRRLALLTEDDTGPEPAHRPVEEVAVMSHLPPAASHWGAEPRGHGPDQQTPAAGQRVVVMLGGMSWECTAEDHPQAMERLVDAGAQGVILGCTEIELLVCAEAIHVPAFPTTRVHVGVAITAALDGVAIG